MSRRTRPASGRIGRRWALGVAGLALAGGAHAVDVPLRCADHGGHFRLVFDLPGERPLAAFRADGTVVLDWPADWRPVAGDACRGDPRLRGWRRQADHLVLTLGGDQGARAFRLSAPARWVVDLGRVTGDLPRRAPLPPPVNPPAPLPHLVPPAPPEVVARARAMAEAGKVAAAIALLKEEGDAGNQPAAVQFELGRLYAESGRALAAGQRLWRAAAQFPQHPAAPGALRRASGLFDRLGFHYQAAKPLESYLRNYPLDPEAMAIQLDLGRFYALAGEPGSAREELIPLTYQGAGGLALHAHFWLAYLLAENGDYQAARDEFQRLSQEDSDYLEAHPELLFAAAETQLETGEGAQAKALLANFLEGNRDHPLYLEALLLQGRALMAMEDWRRAGARFREVLDARPQADLRARARVGIARTDHALNRIGLEQAVARLEAVARGLPGSQPAREARLMAARMLAEAKRDGAALDQLRPVLARGDATARRRARTLVDRLLPREMAAALDAGEPFRAFRLFNRFAGERPSGTVRDRAFRGLLRLGALQGARRFLTATREDQGDTVQIQRWQWLLARGFRRAGAPVGVGWIDRVLDADPGHPRATALRVERARLLSRLDRHRELLRYLDRHAGLPRAQTAPLRARALKAQGRLKAAFRALDGFARQAPAGALPGPVLAEAGDLAARLDRVYRARDYWVRALEAGVPAWERLQLQALLGVDAVQREDFEGARAYLDGLPADSGFGRAGNLYASLIPVIRERLQ